MRNISSLQHPLIKHLVSLKDDRQYRYAKRRLLVSGLKLVREVSALLPLRTLIIEEGFTPGFSCRTEETLQVTSTILKKITGLKNPEPIAAEIDMPQDQDLSSINFLLILDGISDPGNLGTLLRTALALGWEGVFLTPGSCDPFNEKSLRAAKGATFKLPFKNGTWEELHALLKGEKFTILAADIKGRDLKTIQLKTPIALTMGNEAHGIAPELKKIAELISIPMSGPMESLNVASAGAILMFEIKGKA